MERDHPVLGRDVAATASLDELAERVTRLERIVEQIVGVPMPKIVEGDVVVLQHVPQERVQNSVVELSQCPRFGSQSWMGLILSHGSACRIVRRSRS